MNHKDILNEAETEIVTWLQNDSDVEANYIHEKYIKSMRNYTKKQLPAIGIHCFSISQSGGMLKVAGNCEIITAGVTSDSDRDCKEVVAQTFASFKKMVA